jgi:transcription antitermination factor NusG
VGTFSILRSIDMSGYPWYALQVRPRYEKIVASALLSKGYEGFLPLYRHRSRWSDRIKEIHLPLFPGYLFCRFDINRRLPILVTPGIVRVVGVGKAIYPVEESEIAALQAVVVSGLQAQPWSFLNVGQKVRIEFGALTGVEGVLLGVKGSSKLIISVTLLQRSVAVEIDEAWVASVNRYSGPVNLPVKPRRVPA